MIGEKLKIERLKKGISQYKLAELAGINEKYYGRIERNESSPTVEVLNRICLALQIDLLEFFLLDCGEVSNFLRNKKVCEIMKKSLTNSCDVHFNRNILLEKCENVIWYNGYIGSLNFDEFEMKIFAEGNVKAKLYQDWKLVVELNNCDISNELLKYIKSDEELYELASYSDYDPEILDEKKGNVLFIYESNWLTADIINNNNNEIVEMGIILDHDNVLDSFLNQNLLFDFIFK
ncbi:MAG: helix-turn-helix transcriptional regulator [Clostridia bacterium]|nr:helix-turn-helix transcriptional regulator [Clostridia bacterium]